MLEYLGKAFDVFCYRAENVMVRRFGGDVVVGLDAGRTCLTALTSCGAFLLHLGQPLHVFYPLTPPHKA